MLRICQAHPPPTPQTHTLVPVESSQEERDSRGLDRHVEGERDTRGLGRHVEGERDTRGLGRHVEGERRIESGP